MTVNLLCSLTEKYKTFPHELPCLIILENASKALMDTTVEEMSDFLDDWVESIEEIVLEREEEKKNSSPGSEVSATAAWLDKRVMDLDVSLPGSQHVSAKVLRRARDAFVTLALIESQQCRAPRNSTGISSVESRLPFSITT